VSLGDGGAVLAGPESCWRGHAPKIRAVSTIGAGDSFLAGLVWALVQGQNPPDALRLALSAGSAAVQMPGTELCRPEIAGELLAKIEIETVSCG